ncbi:tigger transposable element-derived protein 6-like [Parasteatoda tepidariorum]|uniref:tigger transposable element-derived protein 6-like n=1 Tax=Parasteatoda tepidariorum TaxID=114398 RepID=UPI001C71EC5D|nr:tigger transposable element-derived protein 6-like [Parasteatoda tepidariorum]
MRIVTFKNPEGSHPRANVDKDLCQDWKSRLPIILAGYEDRDVYNLDETGLFFRALPTKSLDEKAEVAKGGKQAKQKLTVCFCANAAFEKEIKPIVIWHSKKPRCFKGKDISQMGVKYHYNKKA